MVSSQAPDTTHRRQQTRRQRIALIVFLVVVGLILVGAYVGTKMQRAADPDNASVGDCMAKSGATDMKRVSCTDGSAAFTVVGKVGNKTEADLGLSSGDICKPFPAAKSAYWRGELGKKGYILCLAPR